MICYSLHRPSKNGVRNFSWRTQYAHELDKYHACPNLRVDCWPSFVGSLSYTCTADSFYQNVTWRHPDLGPICRDACREFKNQCQREWTHAQRKFKSVSWAVQKLASGMERSSSLMWCRNLPRRRGPDIPECYYPKMLKGISYLFIYKLYVLLVVMKFSEWVIWKLINGGDAPVICVLIQRVTEGD